MERPKIATAWLEGCAGCHMSLLDLDEKLLDILRAAELTVSPITDFKGYDFPEVELGIVEGAIGNEEQREIAERLRKRCKILLALGDCAVFGGINTMRNWLPPEEVLNYGYAKTASSVNGRAPQSEELPRLLDRVMPVNHIVDVDIHVPGCPPSPEAIAHAIEAVLHGRVLSLPNSMLHFD